MSGDKRGGIVVWNVDISTSVLRPQRSPITALALHPELLDVAAVGYSNGVVILLNILSENVILRVAKASDEIQSLSFSSTQSGQSWLSFASKDSTVGLIAVKDSSNAELHSTTRQGKGGGGHDKNRAWTSLCWIDDTHFCSTTSSGDVLVWDLQLNSQKWTHAHSRTIFQLLTAPSLNALVSVSMDRNVALWDVKKKIKIWELSTLGGYVYQMAESPVDNSLVALACGDNSIRIWSNQEFFDAIENNSGSSTTSATETPPSKTKGRPKHLSLFSTSLQWKGIPAKVTCVCWHPTSVNTILFGMEDGRVTLQHLENSRTQPFNRAHKQAVYGVSFISPTTQVPTQEYASQFAEADVLMASVGGDGSILLHASPTVSVELNSLITVANPDILQRLSSDLGRSMTSLPRRSCFALSDDGSLLFIGNADGSGELYSWPDLRLLYSTRFHSRLINRVKWQPRQNSSKHVAATASEDGSICLITFSEADRRQPTLCTLKGHSKFIYDLSFSKTRPHLLTSSSADGSVRFWDLDKQMQISYHQHQSTHQPKLLSVLWSSQHDNYVFSAGDDQAMSINDFSLSTPFNGDDKLEEAIISPTESIEQKETIVSENTAPKAKQGGSKAKRIGTTNMQGLKFIEVIDSVQNLSAWWEGERAPQALFPSPAVQSLSNPDIALSEEFYGGDIAQSILKATQQGSLSDTWVALSASGGHSLWRSTCAAYASQLVHKGDIHRAVHYYVAIRDFDKAIATLEGAFLFQDALVLAAKKLSSNHPRVRLIWTNWANYLVHKSNYLPAAKCYMAVGDFVTAGALLKRIGSSDALLLAIRVLSPENSADRLSLAFDLEHLEGDAIFWMHLVGKYSDTDLCDFLSSPRLDDLSKALEFISPISRYLFLLGIAIWNALVRSIPDHKTSNAKSSETDDSDVLKMAALIGSDPEYCNSLAMDEVWCPLQSDSYPSSHLLLALSVAWMMVLCNYEEEMKAMQVHSDHNRLIQALFRGAKHIAEKSSNSYLTLFATSLMTCIPVLSTPSVIPSAEIVSSICHLGYISTGANSPGSASSSTLSLPFTKDAEIQRSFFSQLSSASFVQSQLDSINAPLRSSFELLRAIHCPPVADCSSVISVPPLLQEDTSGKSSPLIPKNNQNRYQYDTVVILRALGSIDVSEMPIPSSSDKQEISIANIGAESAKTNHKKRQRPLGEESQEFGESAVKRASNTPLRDEMDTDSIEELLSRQLAPEELPQSEKLQVLRSTSNGSPSQHWDVLRASVRKASSILSRESIKEDTGPTAEALRTLIACCHDSEDSVVWSTLLRQVGSGTDV